MITKIKNVIMKTMASENIAYSTKPVERNSFLGQMIHLESHEDDHQNPEVSILSNVISTQPVDSRSANLA